MDKNHNIDYTTYSWLLKNINQQVFSDSTNASLCDLNFIKEEAWLCDTAVINRVEKRNGTYLISLVFAHQKNPLKLLIRPITEMNCKKKAIMMSEIFKRQAAKDQRGTITIKEEKLNISLN
ncbi:MAG TPA: hypothetical protein VJ917_00365 [Saprospiraceae bacterium]|nr:hypothetical protein [Saprospiraceae bacterium]